MSSFFLFMTLFLFHVALIAAIDVREMSIDEYINFINPPAVYKYQNQFGETILCVKFADQISVKYSQDNITRGLKKSPKLNPPRINISNPPSGRANISTARGVKSKCPEDTVATREIKREHLESAGSVRQFLNRGRFRRRKNQIIHNYFDDGQDHEYATVIFPSKDDPLRAISARLNVWRPVVTLDAIFSLSQLWLTNDNDGKLEGLEAGWILFPRKYVTHEPVFFVYWTSDQNKNGCYDRDCPGFVQVAGTNIEPARKIAPVSVYGGDQYEIRLSLHLQMHQDAGLVWALSYNEEILGYWPASLFNSLANGGDEVEIGGEISYGRRNPGDPMTATVMGSGHFPDRGYGLASFSSKIQTHGIDGHEVNPEPETDSTNPYCYRAHYTVHTYDEDYGKTLYFGGPEGSSNNHECHYIIDT